MKSSKGGQPALDTEVKGSITINVVGWKVNLTIGQLNSFPYRAVVFIIYCWNSLVTDRQAIITPDFTGNSNTSFGLHSNLVYRYPHTAACVPRYRYSCTTYLSHVGEHPLAWGLCDHAQSIDHGCVGASAGTSTSMPVIV